MRKLSLLAVLLCSLSGTGCPAPVVKTPVPDDPELMNDRDEELEGALEEARAGVRDARLADLLGDHWAWLLAEDPIRATRLGVHGYDDRIEEVSHAAIQRRHVAVDRFLAQARAIDAAALDDGDRLTRELFIAELEAQSELHACDFAAWTLSPRDNPVTIYNELHEVHAVETVEDGANLVARYGQIPRAIDDTIANLARGKAAGLFSTRESTRRVIDMVNKQLAEPIEDWPMLKPLAGEHPRWSRAELSTFAERLSAAVAAIKPALERYGAFLEQSLLPGARAEEQAGLAALPIGRACYRAAILYHTTLRLEPEAIHRIGLEQIAETDARFEKLGATALKTKGTAATIAALRADKSLYFATAEEIEQAAERSLALAKEKMPAFFGILPKADCVVRRIPDYEAPYTTTAYYKPAHVDGSKPGEYFVNVLHPGSRPRFEARVLAVHESIPGHHLQIAIAQERSELPAFRKHGQSTAYVEGWALYTERLAEEMGLYESDLDRLGAVSFDAWRAGRLVVDTGIHAMGWSREQAKAYLTEHTALSPENIDNEVDRYITWPGQALAYKLGQLEWSRLRAEAEAAQGARFSLPAFHDAALSLGAVTLPVLRARLEQFSRGG
jgi:uncharacterized protein (DUF885 family)